MSDTACNRLSKLPSELLVLIFQHTTDFSSLWSLTHTSSYFGSVYDSHAYLITNAILNNKVPSPIRALMQGAFSLHKGTFLCRTPEDALSEFKWSEVPLLSNVSGTSSEFRWLIRLAHHLQVHTRLYIEACMQRCLQGKLGDRKYPEGFEFPTWTEEQRGFLGFWRIVFLNRLRIESHKGSLRWLPEAKDDLWSGRLYWDSDSLFLTCTMQTLMALDYLTGYHSAPKSQKRAILCQVLTLLPIPKEREFGWYCQPPPTWQAISQGQCPDENPRIHSEIFTTPLDTGYDQLARQSSNQSHFRIIDLEEDPSDKAEEERNQGVQAPSPEVNQEQYQPSDETHDLQRPRERYFGPISSSDESDEDYFYSDEDDEDGSHENEDSDESGSIPRVGCLRILYDISDTDSDDYEYPERLEIRRRSADQYVAHPIRDFEPHSVQEEYLELERAPLGLQFWNSMKLNPEGGPGKYFGFDVYSQYGFLLWEEWRMIEFGLWSDNALDDIFVYYRRWFHFLSSEDMAFHKKFRFSWDEDWL